MNNQIDVKHINDEIIRHHIIETGLSTIAFISNHIEAPNVEWVKIFNIRAIIREKNKT